MKLNSIVPVAGLLAVTLLPVSASPRPSASDPASEGAALLEAIDNDSAHIRMDTDTLMNLENTVSWEAHANLLTHVRKEVNDVGQKLLRLEAIRGSLPEWQQKAVARVEPAAVEMATYTRQAIQFLSAHEGELYLRDYTMPVRALYAKSKDLGAALNEYLTYAKASGTEAQLQQALGLKNGD